MQSEVSTSYHQWNTAAPNSVFSTATNWIQARFQDQTFADVDTFASSSIGNIVGQTATNGNAWDSDTGALVESFGSGKALTYSTENIRSRLDIFGASGTASGCLRVKVNIANFGGVATSLVLGLGSTANSGSTNFNSAASVNGIRLEFIGLGTPILLNYRNASYTQTKIMQNLQSGTTYTFWIDFSVSAQTFDLWIQGGSFIFPYKLGTALPFCASSPTANLRYFHARTEGLSGQPKQYITEIVSSTSNLTQLSVGASTAPNESINTIVMPRLTSNRIVTIPAQVTIQSINFINLLTNTYTLSSGNINFSSSYGGTSYITNEGAQTTINSTIQLFGNLSITTGAASGTLGLNGVISGVGGIIISGQQKVDLSATNNTFTGGCVVSGGVLRVTNETSIGSASIVYLGNSSTDTSAQTSLEINSATTFTKDIICSGVTNITSTSGRYRVITSVGSTVTISGNITYSAVGTQQRRIDIGAQVAGGTISITGIITGGTNAGTLAFGGSATNSNTSTIIISNALNSGIPFIVMTRGTVLVRGDAFSSSGVLGTINGSTYIALGDGSISLSDSISFLMDGGNYTQAKGLIVGNAAGQVNMTAYTVGVNTANTVTWSGSIAPAVTGQSLRTVQITAPAGGVCNFSGVISNASPNTLALTKVGAGICTLSGTNTYTGATTVSAGSLGILSSNGNSAVTVSSGATLYGTGTIGGAVTVSPGGFIEAGTLSTTYGVLTLSAGCTFDTANGLSNINVRTTATTATRINITGNCTGGFRLNFHDSSLNAGTYTIITYTGTLTTTGGLTVNTNNTGRTITINTATAGQINIVVV